MSQRHQESKAKETIPEDVERSASYLSEKLCEGFIAHDRRDRETAVEAFAAVDSVQCDHLDPDAVHRAAVGYVDALWAKDDVEESCRVTGELDPGLLESADWSAVEAAFGRRAKAAEIDPRYASLTTEAWIRHKAGGDYWTPTMRAQMFELRAILQNPSYPDKPRGGPDGFGPEPARYALGIELHDVRRWEEAKAAMLPYFQYILDQQ